MFIMISPPYIPTNQTEIFAFGLEKCLFFIDKEENQAGKIDQNSSPKIIILKKKFKKFGGRRKQMMMKQTQQLSNTKNDNTQMEKFEKFRRKANTKR